MINNLTVVLNFNRLFFKLNRFICNQLPVLSDHCPLHKSLMTIFVHEAVVTYLNSSTFNCSESPISHLELCHKNKQSFIELKAHLPTWRRTSNITYVLPSSEPYLHIIFERYFLEASSLTMCRKKDPYLYA